MTKMTKPASSKSDAKTSRTNRSKLRQPILTRAIDNAVVPMAVMLMKVLVT